MAPASSYRFDAVLDLELRAVDRSGAKAALTGAPFRLTGKLRVED